MRPDPVLLLAAGSAIAGVALLVFGGKKTTVVGPRPPASGIPSTAYGETTRVTLSVPTGWRRVTRAERQAFPELTTHAVALRDTPGFASMNYGSISPFVASDGNTYATWIEQHFHEPGGPAKPWGLHHGVTMLAEVRTPTSPLPPQIALADEWNIQRQS